MEILNHLCGRRHGLSALCLAMVAGCATLPGEPPDRQRPISQQAAVVALAGNAQQAELSGDSERAAVIIERALRIEPRNPLLWHRLAQIRLAQEDYGQVVQLASKSNSLLDRDDPLRADNWSLIADAYERSGDFERARAARQRAQ